MGDGRNGALGARFLPAPVLALVESGRGLEHVKEIEASVLVLQPTQNCAGDQNAKYKDLLGMAACPLFWSEDGLETGFLMLPLSMAEASLALHLLSLFGWLTIFLYLMAPG